MVLSKGKFRLSRKLSRSWQVSFSSGPDRLCSSGKKKQHEDGQLDAMNIAKHMHGTCLSSGNRGNLSIFLAARFQGLFKYIC